SSTTSAATTSSPSPLTEGVARQVAGRGRHAGPVFAIAMLAGWPGMLYAEPKAEQLQLCAACHGENGVPQDKNTPVIWGQTQGYLYLQLRDYKRGTRKDDVMSPLAEALERDEMMDLAEYFSQKPWPNLRQPQPPDDVVRRALTTNVAVGCTGCH